MVLSLAGSVLTSMPITAATTDPWSSLNPTLRSRLFLALTASSLVAAGPPLLAVESSSLPAVASLTGLALVSMLAVAAEPSLRDLQQANPPQDRTRRGPLGLGRRSIPLLLPMLALLAAGKDGLFLPRIDTSIAPVPVLFGFGSVLLLLANPVLATLVTMPAAVGILAALLVVDPGAKLPVSPACWPAIVACCSLPLVWTVLVLPGASVPTAHVLIGRACRPIEVTMVGALVVLPLAHTRSSPLADCVLAGLAAACLACRWASGPVLVRIFTRAAPPAGGSRLHSPRHIALLARRFRFLPPWYRFAACGKLRFDPMFPPLAQALPHRGRVLDLGAGYGLVSAWLATARPGLAITCVEPSPARAAVARHVLGTTDVHVHSLDALTDTNPPVWAQDRYDVVLLLDVVHHLERLDTVLRPVRRLVTPGGVLALRTSCIRPGRQRESVSQWWERIVVRLRGQHVARYYPADVVESSLRKAGFDRVERVGRSDAPEVLFLAR